MFIAIATPHPTERQDGQAVTDEQDVSDGEIIRRVLAGERDLFRELVRRHRSVVFSSVFRQVGERSAAEELAQETFVKAYRGLHTFRHEAQFSTWVVCIALNTVSTYFASRAFRERKRTTAFKESEHDRSGARTPEELREEQVRLTRFRDAMAQLPERLREVLILCGVEGKSYEDAAAIIGVPIGTVRSRLNKARLTMRELLAHGDGESER